MSIKQSRILMDTAAGVSLVVISAISTIMLLSWMNSCANVGQVYTAPPVPVCSQAEASDSVICATATKLNLTTEQIDAMFLDASLVGISTKVFSAADLRKVLQDARKWVTEREILNIEGLTRYLVMRAEVDPAMALLLSRRLGMISLPILNMTPLTPYDINMVLAGIDHQLEQLSWF